MICESLHILLEILAVLFAFLVLFFKYCRQRTAGKSRVTLPQCSM